MPISKLKVAAIQTKSGEDKEQNLAKLAKLIETAAAHGAKLIALPEVYNFRGEVKDCIANAEPIPDGPSTQLLIELAKEYKVWIIGGSILEKKDSGLPYNSSIVVGPYGKILAKYHKMHLFDVRLKGQTISESSKSQSGSKPVIAKLDDEIQIGMSICYDLRFPELYRYYSDKGVEILSIPSSFTKITGQAHWHALTRARAIENQAFVIAANQAGKAGQVATFGHSIIIDPWGEILAEADDKSETVIYADLDFKKLHDIRDKFPSLEHRKL